MNAKQSAQHRTPLKQGVNLSRDSVSGCGGINPGRLFCLSGRRRLNQMTLDWFYAITLSHRMSFAKTCALCISSEEEPLALA